MIWCFRVEKQSIEPINRLVFHGDNVVAGATPQRCRVFGPLPSGSLQSLRAPQLTFNSV